MIFLKLKKILKTKNNYFLACSRTPRGTPRKRHRNDDNGVNISHGTGLTQLGQAGHALSGRGSEVERHPARMKIADNRKLPPAPACSS